MKTGLFRAAVIVFCFFPLCLTYPKPDIKFFTSDGYTKSSLFIRNQARLDANRVDTWIQNSGTFNQDLRTNNTPGLMWPKGSNRYASFTAGISIGTYVEGQLKLAVCSYMGEYEPGYINISGGVPSPVTNTDFKFYKVTSTDSSSYDYLNWGLMIPYGAPYVDRNNNGVYDQGIDRPGIKNAVQTIFICMTDGFPETHNQSEGFSGGTAPVFSEMRLTAWAYSKGDSLSPDPVNDIQFLSYVIINKSTKNWDSTMISVVSDPDLGDGSDDFIGCDTTLNLGYIYNADNFDGTGSVPSYGLNPPSSGISYLLSPAYYTGSINDTVIYYDPPGSNNKIIKPRYRELGMTSFTYFAKSSGGNLSCEAEPGTQIEAYRFLSGLKKDGSMWFHPSTKQRTRKVYPGNPETREGWTEFGYNGAVNMAVIKSCAGGDSTSTYMSVPSDRRYLINTGGKNYKVNAGDTVRIILGQMVARGTSNVNSVTKLRNVCLTAKDIYRSNFAVRVSSISESVPESFSLGQNYPNPFNASSRIQFQVRDYENVKITVYGLLGNELATLVNEKLKPGTYETEFDGSSFGSGVYFYRITAGSFTQTRKMILIK